MCALRVEGGAPSAPTPPSVPQSTHPGTVSSFGDLLVTAIKMGVGLLNVFANLTSPKDVALRGLLGQALLGGTKEDQVIAAATAAILWSDEADRLQANAKKAQQKADAAKQKYGANSPQYLRAQADANAAYTEAQIARAEALKAQQQLQVYANDPSYRVAIQGAKKRINGALASQGLQWRAPTRNGTVAQAQQQLAATDAYILQLTGALQQYQAAADAFAQLPPNYNPAVPFRVIPVASAPGSGFDPQTNVAQQKLAYDRNQALYAQGVLALAQGNQALADSNVQWLQAQLKLAEPGTAEYEALQKALDTALANQATAANVTQALQAQYEVASAQVNLDQALLQKTEISQAALGYLSQSSPHLFDPDGFTSPDNHYSGRFVGVKVVIGKDGQLYADFTWTNKTSEIQLTFPAGKEPSTWSDQQRQTNAAWANLTAAPTGNSDVCLAGSNVVDVAQKRLDYANQAVQDLYTQSAQQTAAQTQQDYQSALQAAGLPPQCYAPGHEPGSPGAPDVPPSVRNAWIANTAAQQYYQQMLANGAWLAFLGSQDLSNLDDPETREHFRNQFFAQNPGYRETLFNRYAQLYGEPVSLQTWNTDTKLDNGVGAGLNLQPSNPAAVAAGDMSRPWYSGQELDAIGPVADKIRTAAGPNGTVQVMPVYLAVDGGGLLQTALFVVTDGTGKRHIIDDAGREYKDLNDYQENNQLPKAGTLYLPQNLDYTGDARGNVQIGQLDIAGQSNTTENAVGVVTSVATVLSFTPLAPVAAPVAAAGATYLAVTGVEHLVDMSKHGQSLWSEDGVLTMATVVASLMPEGAALARSARLAKGLDIAGGSLLAASSGGVILTQGDSMSGFDKFNAGLALVSGLAVARGGIHKGANGTNARGARPEDPTAADGGSVPAPSGSAPSGQTSPAAPEGQAVNAAPATAQKAEPNNGGLPSSSGGNELAPRTPAEVELWRGDRETPSRTAQRNEADTARYIAVTNDGVALAVERGKPIPPELHGARIFAVHPDGTVVQMKPGLEAPQATGGRDSAVPYYTGGKELALRAPAEVEIWHGDAARPSRTGPQPQPVNGRVFAVGNGDGFTLELEPGQGLPDVFPTRKYTVAYEMTLDRADFGTSREVHFNRANAALDAEMKSDPRFAAMMEELIPGAQQAVSRSGGRENPPDWTWEHASTSRTGGQEGVMRLVPTYEHTPGSVWWRTLHPDPGASGGYSEWAIPAGARKN